VIPRGGVATFEDTDVRTKTPCLNFMKRRAVISDEALVSFANAAQRAITAIEIACRQAEP